MKTFKLILGIILLIVAIVLYLLKTIDYRICLGIGAIGLILIVLSFFCCKKRNLPVVVGEAAPVSPVETTETNVSEAEIPSSEPVEVVKDEGSQDQDTQETHPTN